MAWLAFMRGQTHLLLASYRTGDDLETAINLFSNLTKSGKIEPGPPIDAIYLHLGYALRQKGLPDKAELAVDEGLRQNKESTELRQLRVRIAWDRDQFEQSLMILGDAADRETQYMRSVAGLMSREMPPQLEKGIDEFLKTSPESGDYIRLIYYWRLMRERRPDEARKLLEDRWREIDPASWRVRLGAERGDYTAVWREKLIGYYLGKMPEKENWDVVEDRDRFEASPFARASYSRLGFLCEWRFYDALLQSLTGDPATRRVRMFEGLEKAIDTKQVTFDEHDLARSLVGRMAKGEDLSLGQ